MNKSGKAIIFLLILVSIAAIALSGAVYFSWEKEKAQSASLAKKIDQLEAEKQALEKDVEGYKKEATRLNSELDQSAKRIQELKYNLEDESRKKEEALSQLNPLKKELEDAKSAKGSLEAKIAKAEEALGSLKEQIAKLENEKQDLEARLADTGSKSSVQLGKIIVGSESASSAAGRHKSSAKAAEGKILVVNKEYSFVVINLGARDGVASGNMFSVYQNDKNIGDIVIERVDETMSSANFTDTKLKDIVREDDKVVTKQ